MSLALTHFKIMVPAEAFTLFNTFDSQMNKAAEDIHGHQELVDFL